jgi:hypothetical protein
VVYSRQYPRAAPVPPTPTRGRHSKSPAPSPRPQGSLFCECALRTNPGSPMVRVFRTAGCADTGLHLIAGDSSRDQPISAERLSVLWALIWHALAQLGDFPHSDFIASNFDEVISHLLALPNRHATRGAVIFGAQRRSLPARSDYRPLPTTSFAACCQAGRAVSVISSTSRQKVG